MGGKAPLIIMGGISFFGGIFAILLPETLGANLPESVNEVSIKIEENNMWHKFFKKSLHKSRLKNCTKIPRVGGNGYQDLS